MPQTTDNRFERRRGKGKRTISLTCPKCGYKQYDVQPGSRRGSAAVVGCARCGFEGEVVEVKG